MVRGTLLPLAHRDPAEDLDAELMVRSALNRHGHRWVAEDGDGGKAAVEFCPDPAAHAEDMKAIGQALAALGLISAPGPSAPATARRKAAASRPQLTGELTRQQQDMAGRIAVFAAHLDAGLNWLQAATEMEISRKTARRYAAAISGTGTGGAP
jgi:hypothetical protein